MLTRTLLRNFSFLTQTTRFCFSNGFNNFQRQPKKPKKDQQDTKQKPKQTKLEQNVEKDLYGDNKKEEPKVEKEQKKTVNDQNQKEGDKQPMHHMFKLRRPGDKKPKQQSGIDPFKAYKRERRLQPLENKTPETDNTKEEENKPIDNLKAQSKPEDNVNINDTKNNLNLDPKQQQQTPKTSQNEDSQQHINPFERRKKTSESNLNATQKPQTQKPRQKRSAHRAFNKKGFQNEHEEAWKQEKKQQDKKKREQQQKMYRQQIFNFKASKFQIRRYLLEIMERIRERYSKLVYKVFQKYQWNKSYIPTFSLYFPVAVVLTIALLTKLYYTQNLNQISFSQLTQKINQLDMQPYLTVLTTTQPISQRQSFTKVVVTGRDRNGGTKFQCQIDNEKTLLNLVQKKNEQLQQPIIVYTHKNMKMIGTTSALRLATGFVMFLFVMSLLKFARGIMAKKMPTQNTMDKMLGSVFGKGKKMKSISTVKFSAVAGMEPAKKEIAEFVEFLKDPKKFHDLGARIPRGALLSGPPGTGKTMLAKACAGEAGVSFFSLSGSEFVEMYVGVGASRVRDLFKQAKKSAPSIIFIDEIDAVGRKRAHGQFGGNDERDSTLNQLLVQMDGFNTKSDVVVFAATNRKQLLDPALTRPGRFDRTIQIDLPDLQGRKHIFLVHLTPLKLNTQSMTIEDYAKRLATLTPGFSGADIANLCNQAAIMAARKNNKLVEKIDFEMASERVLAGTVKKNMMTEEDRKVVAYHESGHGVVSWFLEGASPLLKLTIIPRSKGSLGFAQYLPDDKVIHTRENLLDEICVILGGRITEEKFFGRITTGAQDDLDKVAKLANRIVKDYGMTEELGNVNYGETDYIKEYSEEYARKIDNQVKKIIRNAEKKTRELVNEHKDKIQKLADTLLEKQTIDNKVIREVLGDRPFGIGKTYSDYISNA